MFGIVVCLVYNSPITGQKPLLFPWVSFPIGNEYYQPSFCVYIRSRIVGKVRQHDKLHGKTADSTNSIHKEM